MDDNHPRNEQHNELRPDEPSNSTADPNEDENEEEPSNLDVIAQYQYENNFEDTYKDVLHSLSKHWLVTQLCQKVSAKAANQFWDLSITYLPKLVMFKEREGNVKNIPKFIQERRKLYQKYCPDVQMEFGFQKKSDGSIIKVSGSSTPLKDLQQNPEYQKLYEIASIKVINNFIIITYHPIYYLYISFNYHHHHHHHIIIILYHIISLH